MGSSSAILKNGIKIAIQKQHDTRMRLAFLNSSLQPGKDGVGDYTHLLARECIRQGHHVCLVALQDQWITEPTPERISLEERSIDILRLPARWPWKERILQAKTLLETFEPDWVSLQFVCYAFHPKGIVSGLAGHLKHLTAQVNVQIMFHELWIGDATSEPIKHKLVGQVQKRYILSLARQLKPKVIHTSNEAYIQRLKQGGISARLLPMFGNIPVVPDCGEDWLLSMLKERGLPISRQNRQQFWLIGLFGSLPADWPPEPLLTVLYKAAVQKNRQAVLLSIGNLQGGERLWQRLSEKYESMFRFFQLGMQPSERISQYLSELDFGVATTNYGKIGKSATAASMLEHGLPVIVNQDDVPYANTENRLSNSEGRLLKLNDQLLNHLVSGIPRCSGGSRLPHIATQFLRDLSGGV